MCMAILNLRLGAVVTGGYANSNTQLSHSQATGSVLTPSTAMIWMFGAGTPIL